MIHFEQTDRYNENSSATQRGVKASKQNLKYNTIKLNLRHIKDINRLQSSDSNKEKPFSSRDETRIKFKIEKKYNAIKIVVLFFKFN